MARFILAQMQQETKHVSTSLVVVQDQKLARLQTLRFDPDISWHCIRTWEVEIHSPCRPLFPLYNMSRKPLDSTFEVLLRDQHFRSMPFFRNYL